MWHLGDFLCMLTLRFLKMDHELVCGFCASSIWRWLLCGVWMAMLDDDVCVGGKVINSIFLSGIFDM